MVKLARVTVFGLFLAPVAAVRSNLYIGAMHKPETNLRATNATDAMSSRQIRTILH